MRILICDDDRDIATQLQKILQCFFQKNLFFNNPNEKIFR